MIRNDSRGTVLARRVRLVRGLLAQGLGLMFRARLRDFGWVFLFSRESRWHITNLFVFQSIDVLWIDRAGRVLQVRTVRPFTLHVSGAPGSWVVIELPAGTALRTGTRPGDVVSWSVA